MSTLTVRVPMTPPRALSPNARVHWRTRNRAFQDAKSATFYAFRDTINLNDPGDCFQRESWPLRLSYVVAWGKGHRRMDDDNCKASLKAFQDGVASALGIDDRNFTLGTVEQVRDPEGLGYVDITVESIAERSGAWMNAEGALSGVRPDLSSEELIRRARDGELEEDE